LGGPHYKKNSNRSKLYPIWLPLTKNRKFLNEPEQLYMKPESSEIVTIKGITQGSTIYTSPH